MRKKKSKKIAKLVWRQMITRNTCSLILMIPMKKVMQVYQPMIIQRSRNRAVITHLKYVKKSAHNQGNVEDVMFKNLFSGELKLKGAENVNKSSKTNSIGVDITGPFCNSKTRKSHWVVVYGDSGNALMVKSEFIPGCISAALPGQRQSIIDINHCHS